MMAIRLTLLWLWKLIDPLFYYCSRLYCIKDEENKRSIFRVRVTKYKGAEVVLSDGTIIGRNDLLLKIHLHNVSLLSEYTKIKNDIKRSRMMYRLVHESMPTLSKYLKKHPKEDKIKAIIGITTLNRGVHTLGFECFKPKSIWYRRFKQLGQLPIFILSGTPLKYFQKHQLTYLFLSKEILYQKYGQNSSRN
ncbi:YkoP family protein [Neobacillus paridis]|jgi:hypothetical protein|nr:hypothetical protein [Neobacillus paridis]